MLHSSVQTSPPEPGVSRQLAASRRASIRQLQYDVLFELPGDLTTRPSGCVTLRIEWDSRPPETIWLDFAGPAAHVLTVQVDERPADWAMHPGHLAIATASFPVPPERHRTSTITIAFIVPQGGLHRRDDLVYSLFVPARAHRAFPCFDQPDIKAPLVLTLVVPEDWTAVSNGPAVTADRLTNGHGRSTRKVRFAETAPLPTYLYAFAAGLLEAETTTLTMVDGATIPFRVVHDGRSSTLVQEQVRELAARHEDALRWLHGYTDCPYAYGKLDVVLIPGFEFGGMEHPGAIFYAAHLMVLDEMATRESELERATLIAHETSHMWFGNLVTIRWFDDVWLKEMFATYFASRIVEDWFPDVDHDLRFFVHNVPSAYDVDRTAGAHPIRQPLENLDDAGTLYGAIIYRKAPIVLRQLEWALGADDFRRFVQTYVRTFRHGVADWCDVMELLTGAGFDGYGWSQRWIDVAGRPTIDLTGRPIPSGRRPPYGLWLVDQDTRRRLLEHITTAPDPMDRAVWWMVLWDDVLDGRLAVGTFLESVRQSAATERTDRVLQFVAALGTRAAWRMVPLEERRHELLQVEGAWSQCLAAGGAPERMRIGFWAYQQVALSVEASRRLERYIAGEPISPGFCLSERERVGVALALAVATDSVDPIEILRGTLTSADELARVRLLARAVAVREADREALFETLCADPCQARESWIVEAVGLLNHPLRAHHARRFVRAGLDALTTVQRRGDIFFPKRWCDALLHGQAGTDAHVEVRSFLAESEGLPERLRRTVLQSADDLFRAAALTASRLER